MASPLQLRTVHRMIGVLVLVALLVLTGGVMLVARERHWFEGHVIISVDVEPEFAGPLRRGLPVKLLGAPAGEVLAIDVQPLDADNHVWLRARIEIADSFYNALRADASAVIHTPVAGLLGDAFVELLPGTALTALPKNGVLRGRPQEDILAEARRAIAQFGDMAQQVRDLVAENRGSVKTSAAAVAPLLAKIDSLTAQLDAVIAENRENVKGTVASARATADRLPPMADATADAARAVAGAAAAVERTADEVTATVNENRPGIKIAIAGLEPLLEKLNAAAGSVSEIAAGINRGEGTVGKLLHDDTVHDETVETIQTLNERLAELKPIIESINAVKLYMGAFGGVNAETQAMSGLAFIRVEPRPWKFYLGGVSYRTAPKDRAEQADDSTGLPVDFNLVIGWRWITPRDDWYVLTAAGGVIESRVGGWIDIAPIPNERILLTILARTKMNDRDELDRRYEEGKVLVRACVQWRVWRRVFIVAGGDDLIDDPVGWGGLRLELQDNDLRNVTQAAALAQ